MSLKNVFTGKFDLKIQKEYQNNFKFSQIVEGGFRYMIELRMR